MNSGKITLLIAEKDCYKTTTLLHLLYNNIDQIEPENEVAIVVTPKPSLDSRSLFFGRYSPVDIDSLARIQLKFIETFDELIQYLADFHLTYKITGKKPRFLAIDSVESYFEL